MYTPTELQPNAVTLCKPYMHAITIIITVIIIILLFNKEGSQIALQSQVIEKIIPWHKGAPVLERHTAEPLGGPLCWNDGALPLSAKYKRAKPFL